MWGPGFFQGLFCGSVLGQLASVVPTAVLCAPSTGANGYALCPCDTGLGSRVYHPRLQSSNNGLVMSRSRPGLTRHVGA